MPSKAVVVGTVILVLVLAMCGFYIGSKLSSFIRYSMVTPFVQGPVSPSTALLVIGIVSLAVGVFLNFKAMMRLIRSTYNWVTIGLVVTGTTLLALGLNAVADAAIWSPLMLG